jgi:hypothetical protein
MKRRRHVLCALALLSGCDVGAAESACEGFARTLCERTTACDESIRLGVCLTNVEQELRCDAVYATTGDVERCSLDVSEMSCDDVKNALLPATCGDVEFLR